MAIDVTVVKKFHDGKGQLIGYRIVDCNNTPKDVRKEALKAAVVNGQVTVNNMTLTKDGRFIGRAMNAYTPATASAATRQLPYDVVEIYNLGKDIIGVMVNEQRFVESGNVDISHRYTHVPRYMNFLNGERFKEMLKSGMVSNVKIADGKLVLGENVKKKQFKAVVDKMMKVIFEECHTGLVVTVTKSEDKSDKYGYIVEVACGARDDVTMNAISVMLYYLIKENKQQFKRYLGWNRMEFKCITGIKDARDTFKVLSASKKKG